MTYKITAIRRSDITLITTVEFDFDGIIVTQDIPHPKPKTYNEIKQNINNAAQGEIVRMNDIEELEVLMPTIPINEITLIE